MIPSSNDIRIEVTTECNYNCIICPHSELTRKFETMSNALFCDILDKVLAETDQYDTVTFSGMGEPLLDSLLVEKVEYVKSKGMRALLLTNGLLLTDSKFAELEEAGLDSVRVSMYGDSEDTYCAVHGVAGVFSGVRDELVSICGRDSECDVILTYNIIDGVNDSTLDDWINFWSDKAGLLEVWRPHNWVDAKEYRVVQSDQKRTCGRPYSGPLQVQVDGSVNMCCFDYDGILVLGDVKTQGLADIFSGDMYRRIDACHNGVASGLICEGCAQRNEDKSDVMVFNSRFDIADRVKRTSSTYVLIGRHTDEA